MLEILVSVLLGCVFGTFTGLIPGVHINLVSLLLLSLSGALLSIASPLTLAAFVVSMGVVHSFLDSIPSVFLGAPDADQVLNVLPGHRLLLRGMGYEAVKLTLLGSLLCLLFTVPVMMLLIPVVPAVYEFISPHIGWILLGVVVFMILRCWNVEKIFWSFFLFALSGVLGIIVLGMNGLAQPLLPMLSGLFGVSSLLLSLNSSTDLPLQRVTEMIKVKKWNMVKVLPASVFSGSLTGLFPGLGAAQAAIIGMQLVGKIGSYSFMVMVGGINTVNFVFSILTLYTIEKARNGAILVVKDILGGLDFYGFLALLAVALLAGGVATYLAFAITKVFSKLISKVDYTKLCLGVIGFVSVLVLIFSGWLGVLVMVVSTLIGMIAPMLNVGRNMAMGCLLLPVILFFLL